MARTWTGAGPDFQLDWGGRTWSLNVADARPGLRIGEEAGPLLALEGVAAVHRWAADALSGASLVGFERRFDRLEATYAPDGWDELSVRAAWSPSGDAGEGVDLEVQVSTLSVGRLRGVEVKLASVLPEPADGRGRRRLWAEPRDARSAIFSYDGREPDLRGLTTLPIADDGRLAPRVLPAPWPGGGWYLEMVHPHDAARRITESTRISSVGHTTRYGLFGHDLEKGVVLRARLRGLWIRSEAPGRDAMERYERFVAEPPPLGI